MNGELFVIGRKKEILAGKNMAAVSEVDGVYTPVAWSRSGVNTTRTGTECVCVARPANYWF